MADQEKIQTSALLTLFTELQLNAIPLKMLLLNGDDMHLAYIADISKRKKALHFKVNSPGGYRSLSEETDPSHLRFEFTDIANTKYVFETNTWKLSSDKIWIELPKFVHRYQRRQLFRLEAPHGTRLFFNVNDIRYKLLVIDVSLSGTLGVLASLTEQMEQELKPYTSKLLENAELSFPSEDHKKAGSIVNIKHYRIIRQERNPMTNKFECAIEFKEISEAEQIKLTDLFYKWQRIYLRKRRALQA
jgi:c-di-GMP-binding flagellar brake protein YcgR